MTEQPVAQPVEPPVEQPAAARHAWAVLRDHPRFRRLLGALAVSQVGDWAYNVALVVTVYEQTRSGTLVAVTGAARVLPLFVAGPLGGILVDRFDLRRLMVGCDVLRALLMTGFAVCVATRVPVALFPVLAFLTTVVTSPYQTGTAALVARMLPDAGLAAANSARSIVSEASVVVGPLVGSGLVAVGQGALAFAVNAVTFAGAAAVLLSLPRNLFGRSEPEHSDGLLADLAAGLAVLGRYPGARVVAGADVLVHGVYGVFSVLLLLLARGVTGSPATYGVLLMVSGIGGILGAAAAAPLLTRAAPRTALVLGLLVFAAGFALTGAAPSGVWLPAAGLGAVLVGAAGTLVEVQSDTTMQTVVPERLFGRVYGFVVPMSYAAQALGAASSPALGNLRGPRGGLLACALLLVAYVAWVVRATRATRTTPAPSDETT